MNRLPLLLVVAVLVIALTGCALLVGLGAPEFDSTIAFIDPFGFDEFVEP